MNENMGKVLDEQSIQNITAVETKKIKQCDGEDIKLEN